MLNILIIFFETITEIPITRTKLHKTKVLLGFKFDLIAFNANSDEIKLTTGILGVVTDVDTIYIKVKIAENTTVKVDKNAIAKILPKNTIKPAKN